MKIDLDKIGQDGLDVAESLDRAWLTEMLGTGSLYEPNDDGRVEAHLARIDDTVHVRGRAKATLEAPCGRCTRPAHLALDVPIDVTMVPKSMQPNAGANGELQGEDMGLAVYVDRSIDLTGVVRDELMLELPMRALCQADCAGLCIRCGANLNDSACGCAPVTDSPLRGLDRVKLN